MALRPGGAAGRAEGGGAAWRGPPRSRVAAPSPTRVPRPCHPHHTPLALTAPALLAPPSLRARARLEFKLTHESMSAAEEKRTREQKERLERTERANAVRAAALSARLDALKAESGGLRGQITEIDKQVGGAGGAQGWVGARRRWRRVLEGFARGRWCQLPAAALRTSPLFRPSPHPYPLLRS
jgi:hypothetical protein